MNAIPGFITGLFDVGDGISVQVVADLEQDMVDLFHEDIHRNR